MKLHYHPISPYSRKVRAALLYRGEAHECRLLDVRAGDLASPAFRAISPFGKMPVLETIDGPLYESTSIIEWLEAKGPRRLLPRGAERVARHWDRVGDLYLADPMSTIWFDPSQTEAKRPTVYTAWGLFAAQLVSRDFVCGRHFTLGDLSAAIATDYLERLGEDPPPAVRAWRERCFAIPAMADALAEALPRLDPILAARKARLSPPSA